MGEGTEPYQIKNTNMDYNDILTKLKKGVLAETFTPVRRKVAEVGNWEIAEETERLWRQRSIVV